MPFLRITSSAPAPADLSSLYAKVAQILIDQLDKQLEHVMIHANFGQHLIFGGSTAPSAFVELASIGDTDVEKNKAVFQAITALLGSELGVFINLAPADAQRWGWHGTTVAHLLA